MIEIYVERDKHIIKTLGSETRLKIMMALAQGEKSITELARELDIPQPTITLAVKKLEEAGLVTSRITAGKRGTKKLVSLKDHHILLHFIPVGPPKDVALEKVIDIPVGSYTAIEAYPSCGIANEKGVIGYIDDPSSFWDPKRFTAQIIWTSKGWVEYAFPVSLPEDAVIEEVAVSLEISSEAPLHNPDYPSDITFWINDVEVATWTSPGDPGGKEERGKLNPSWWEDDFSQHGFLKTVAVNNEGSFIDGSKIKSGKMLNRVLKKVQGNKLWKLKIGNKPDAQNIGGFNIFGKKFGSYPININFKVRYRVP